MLSTNLYFQQTLTRNTYPKYETNPFQILFSCKHLVFERRTRPFPTSASNRTLTALQHRVHRATDLDRESTTKERERVRRREERRAGRERDGVIKEAEVLRRKQYPEAEAVSKRRCEMAAAIALWLHTRAQLISLINRGRCRDNSQQIRVDTVKRTDQHTQGNQRMNKISREQEKKAARRVSEKERSATRRTVVERTSRKCNNS